MTRPIRSALLIASLVAAVALPSVVSAATADECQTAIGDLSAATASATFSGNQAAKEEAGLIRKLDGASDALTAGKFADAVKKLTDFRSHAVTISQNGKLDPTDAAGLAQRVDDAIACVSSIGA